MNTKQVTAKSILDTVKSNLEYFKKIDKVNLDNDTLENDLARVSEMLEKTQNLMNPNLIGNIRYIEDDLTVDQENQSKQLIRHLGLDWEASCLSPEKNKRIVQTASQLQIKQKVYKGSSESWKKFEPYLGGIFDKFFI